MLCQNCEKNEATTHIKQIINGEMTETHLCRDCARVLGAGDMLSEFNFSLSDLFGGFFSDMLPAAGRGATVRCPQCGSSFDDIVNSGKLGCAQCYEVFYEKLQPSLQRLHGKIRHSGKVGCAAGGEKAQAAAKPAVPAIAEQKQSDEERLTALQEQMDEAVKEQNFELAASLRDEIKAIKGGHTE